MCCLLAVLLLLGPRAGILVWALIEPRRWEITFDSWIWPVLGFVFVPWTTLMYVLVAPGGIDGLDALGLVLAFAVDLSSYGGGLFGSRGRLPSRTV